MIGNGNKMIIKRGDIFLANLEPIRGSEQGGIRPVLIIQNDIFAPVAMSSMHRAPFHRGWGTFLYPNIS